jgi:ankyrin repeat protein
MMAARLAALGCLVALAGAANAQVPGQGFPCPGPNPTACVRDLNAKDPSGYTVLATVLFNPRLERETKLEQIRQLLDAGTNLNIDHGGWGRQGALGLARREEPQVIALLVSRGATLAGVEGRGPLATAIEMDRDDLALALVRRDRKVTPADRLALPLAARRGMGAVVAALLEAGAEVDVADTQGMTALMHAERRRDAGMTKSLLAAGAKRTAATARAGPVPGTGFDAIAAREIDEVAFFDPPRFALWPGRETPFAFYGKVMNQFEQVSCERTAGFDLIAKANQAGGILVGVCAKEARRVRELAAGAQPALDAVLSQLSQSGGRLDPAARAKLGWTSTRQTGANGAEEYFFTLLAIGHGVIAVPTFVLVPRGARRAVVVQADTYKLCEGYGLEKQTALCLDTRQALGDIARRIDARVTN